AVRGRARARAQEHLDRVDAVRVRALTRSMPVRARAYSVPAESAYALDSLVGAYPHRRTGVHFAGICASRMAAATIVGACAGASLAAARAEELSPEEARTLAFGREIFKVKATCQFCHKWDGSGDQGYGGNALSLRKTHLTPAQLAEVVKCGRPHT